MRTRIERACLRSGRRPQEVRLLPVSKGVAVSRLTAARSVGMTELAENRVQEAEAKAGGISGIRWEMVGRLQANKAARALDVFSVVHSVDSVDLARRLDRLVSDRPNHAARQRLPVYLQVNVDDDPAKAGFAPTALEASLPELLTLDRLDLAGLMTIGRQTTAPEEARPTFAGLRELSLRLRGVAPALGGGLSMGMTDDFEVAVEEGATVVRVGRAIFGPSTAAG